MAALLQLASLALCLAAEHEPLGPSSSTAGPSMTSNVPASNAPGPPPRGTLGGGGDSGGAGPVQVGPPVIGPPPGGLAGARYDAASHVVHHSHLPVQPFTLSSSLPPDEGRHGGVLSFPSTATVGGFNYGPPPATGASWASAVCVCRKHITAEPDGSFRPEA